MPFDTVARKILAKKAPGVTTQFLLPTAGGLLGDAAAGMYRGKVLSKQVRHALETAGNTDRIYLNAAFDQATGKQLPNKKLLEMLGDRRKAAQWALKRVPESALAGREASAQTAIQVNSALAMQNLADMQAGGGKGIALLGGLAGSAAAMARHGAHEARVARLANGLRAGTAAGAGGGAYYAYSRKKGQTKTAGLFDGGAKLIARAARPAPVGMVAAGMGLKRGFPGQSAVFLDDAAASAAKNVSAPAALPMAGRGQAVSRSALPPVPNRSGDLFAPVTPAQRAGRALQEGRLLPPSATSVSGRRAVRPDGTPSAPGPVVPSTGLPDLRTLRTRAQLKPLPTAPVGAPPAPVASMPVAAPSAVPASAASITAGTPARAAPPYSLGIPAVQAPVAAPVAVPRVDVAAQSLRGQFPARGRLVPPVGNDAVQNAAARMRAQPMAAAPAPASVADTLAQTRLPNAVPAARPTLAPARGPVTLGVGTPPATAPGGLPARVRPAGYAGPAAPATPAVPRKSGVFLPEKPPAPATPTPGPAAVPPAAAAPTAAPAVVPTAAAPTKVDAAADAMRARNAATRERAVAAPATVGAPATKKELDTMSAELNAGRAKPAVAPTTAPTTAPPVVPPETVDAAAKATGTEAGKMEGVLNWLSSDAGRDILAMLTGGGAGLKNGMQQGALSSLALPVGAAAGGGLLLGGAMGGRREG